MTMTTATTRYAVATSRYRPSVCYRLGAAVVLATTFTVGRAGTIQTSTTRKTPRQQQRQGSNTTTTCRNETDGPQECASVLHHKTTYIAAEPVCGSYLAPSTIPGAGLGIFAGRDLKRGEEALRGDLLVPLMDIPWHNDMNADDLWILWDEYTWWAGEYDGMDDEGTEMYAFSFGIGAAVNCYIPGNNVETTHPELDTAGLHRSVDPGSGAFTPHHNRRTFASEDIAAGQELFADYGTDYFTSRTGGVLASIPLADDFDAADQIVHNFVNMRDALFYYQEEDEEEEWEEEDDLWTRSVAFQEMFFSFVNSIQPVWHSRILNAFPEDYKKIEHEVDYDTSMWDYHTLPIRSLDELQRRGACADNIRPGQSTVPEAGRGGFATRSIKEGAVIAAGPLIHVGDRNLLNMYNERVDEYGAYVRDVFSPAGRQLVLNYCFGHANTTILLCPYGVLTQLINHAPTDGGANARITWNRNDMSRHPEWLDQPIEAWIGTKHAGLVFDYVATKDIRPGEEIFIDYGEEWQAAWDKHVADWRPPPGSADFKHGYELVPEFEEDMDLLDLSSNRRIKSGELGLFCREQYRVIGGLEPIEYSQGSSCRILRPNADDDDATTYVVELTLHEDDSDEGVTALGDVEILFRVPLDAFYFREAPYTRDHTQSWAFRHDMRIPDDVMPPKWFNQPSSYGM